MLYSSNTVYMGFTYLLSLELAFIAAILATLSKEIGFTGTLPYPIMQ